MSVNNLTGSTVTMSVSVMGMMMMWMCSWLGRV